MPHGELWTGCARSSAMPWHAGADEAIVRRRGTYYTQWTSHPEHAMTKMLRLSVFACCLCLPAMAWGEDKNDLRQQQDQQRHVQSETDHAVRRLQTILRILSYHQVDADTEKKLFTEISGTLAGLSKEQMTEIIQRLDVAAKASDPGQSQKEADAAYAKHREVLDTLQALLAKQQLIKSLDQAADKLEKASKEQFDMSVRSSEFAQPKTDWLRPRQPSSRRQMIDQADRQLDLQREISNTFRQLDKLRDQLAPDQQDRLRQAEALAHKFKLDGELQQAAEQLRQGKPNDAIPKQRKAAGDLQEMARALRANRDKLNAILEAKAKLDAAAKEQQALRDESQKDQDPRKQDQARREKPDGKNNPAETANRQAAVELDTRDAKNLLKPHANELAEKLTPAEKAMQEAQQALKDNNPSKAAKPQAKASEKLDEVRKQLDQMIADAEKKLGDPLAALQDAKETIDKLIQEQQSARQDTLNAEAGKQKDRLNEIAPKQQDLAQRTEDLKHQPMPSKPETQEALDRAVDGMRQAAKALEDQKGAQAVGKQEKALQALHEAKQQIQDQAAAIEKRREDMAALEEANKKLDELANREGNVADQAKAMAQKDDAGEAKDASKQLAKEQSQVADQTQKLQKKVESASRQSAKKLGESKEKMDAAKEELNKPKFKEGAEQAQAAKDKLEEAQKAVQQALAQKQADEAADQAASTPEQMRLANAAQQVAKALEQAEEAAQQSGKAAEQAQANPQEAGQSAKQSQAANEKARSALQQAQAQAPQAVQPSLGKADNRLQQANEQLQQAQPAQANQSQQQAVNQLQTALTALNKALEANGQQQAMPGQQPTAQASKQEGGQQGDKQQANNNQGKEQNDNKGKGDRTPDGQLSDAESKLTESKAGGSFIHLPARQRELIRQALGDKLPPEYASFIQQYYVNVSKGKSATTGEKK